MDLSLRNRLEKYALDQGFSIPLAETDGWIAFQAHAVPARLALFVDADGTLLVGTSHKGVGQELSKLLTSAPMAHEGFYCFQAPSTSELYRIIGRIWSLAKALPNEPLTEFERLVQEAPLTTEVERLRKERIGQDVFRRALLHYWDNTCAVTAVCNPTLLRASHIIPWADCKTDEDRLNVHNGLLLVANLDAAFDAGLISFEDSGAIIISQKLKPGDCRGAGINQSMSLKRISEEHQIGLRYHRESILQ